MTITIEETGQAFATAEDIRTGAGSLSQYVETIHQGVWVEGFTVRAVAAAAGKPKAYQNVSYWAAVGALLDTAGDALEVQYGGALNLWNAVKSIGVPAVRAILTDADDLRGVSLGLDRAIKAKAEAKAGKAGTDQPAAKGEGSDADKDAAPAPATLGDVAKAATPLLAKMAKMIRDAGTIDADDVAAVDAALKAAVAAAKAVETVRRSVDAKAGTDRTVAKPSKSVATAAA